MSRPRTTFAEPRTKNPVFPLRIDPRDPHRILDSKTKWSSEDQTMVPDPRLVDVYVSASDAAWVVRQSNTRWETAQKERAERLANEERERRAALKIPGVRPNAPSGQGKDLP